MISPLRASLLTGLLLTVQISHAQTTESGTVPLRSVAMLVDVSASVGPEFSKQARDIVVDIVTGRGFLGASGWVCNFESPEVENASGEEIWPADESLKQLFKPYWERGPAQQKPLTGKGKALYLSAFGSLPTTLLPPKAWALNNAEDVVSVLTAEYPQKFQDQNTCYLTGVVRIANRVLDVSEEGCYFFIASDQWDDPDWRRTGSRKWVSDLEEAGIYSATAFPEEISRKFKALRSEERYHLIARFHRGDRPGQFYGDDVVRSGSRKYMRLSWYAIGPKPAAIVPPPPVVPPAPGQPEPPKPPPPAFARSLTVLGGLVTAADATDATKPADSRIKVFRDAQPFLAWQVDGPPVAGVDSSFDVSIRRLREDGTLEDVQRVKSANLHRTSEGRLRGLRTGTGTLPLADGVYRLTIEEKPAISSSSATAALLAPVAVWIEVQTPFKWMPWLLTLSLLGAAGVISYSIWTLRR